jgi:hypothetical protein
MPVRTSQALLNALSLVLLLLLAGPGLSQAAGGCAGCGEKTLKSDKEAKFTVKKNNLQGGVTACTITVNLVVGAKSNDCGSSSSQCSSRNCSRKWSLEVKATDNLTDGTGCNSVIFSFQERIGGDSEWERLNDETYDANDYEGGGFTTAFDSGDLQVRCKGGSKIQNVKAVVTASDPSYEVSTEDDELSLELDCFDCKFPADPPPN